GHVLQSLLIDFLWTEMQTLPTEDTLPLPSLNEPAQAAGPLPDGTGHRVDPAAPGDVCTPTSRQEGVSVGVSHTYTLKTQQKTKMTDLCSPVAQISPATQTSAIFSPSTESRSCSTAQLWFSEVRVRVPSSPAHPALQLKGSIPSEDYGWITLFTGDFFWTLDNSWAPSPARRITEVWGVPSPIDTVFTRSNCRSKTYIFKGNNYWRFENGILDPGYPKFISVEFEGFDMSGKIVAALPVPATRRRPESVYFFRTGGRVQKYSFGPEATSSCRRKFPIVAGEKQPAGQINIRVSWKGFPSLVTSAVSVPNPHKPDGYDYYIFSNDKYYIIKVVGERLALATTPNRASQDNSAHRWLKCPLASR
uniref:Proteoglycan 4a n=1 Tax=Scleropages formosus TaxID=113540 RepID=A0A8C9UBD4_SCLFO